MGLLILGSALSWLETKRYARYVRQAGVQQFLHMYAAHRDVTVVPLVWGDEVEYSAVYLDHARNEARVALVASELLPSLEGKGGFLWAPEFGDFMIEGIPGEPFTESLDQLLTVESSLSNRRRCLAEALSAVSPNIVPLTIAAFPRLGCGNFTEPTKLPSGEIGTSVFIPEDMINHHERFRAFERNIRERRGERPAINIPMYQDSQTDPEYFSRQDIRQGETHSVAGKGQVYMDHMGFGMSNCCIQMTYQAANIDQARYMYDQLAIIGPIIVALSNNSPLFHGFLSDIDCRMPVIEQSVDDRTHQERAPTGAPGAIPNSRYSVIDCYLACDDYNDIPVPTDQESYETLIAAGVDSVLSRHISHLFIRDPLLLYSHTLEEDNSISSLHFDNLNSSNWNNVRFKPPPVNSQMGWRVEFRPIDLQLTDFENAAFMVFTNLLLRVFLQETINLYIPVSQLQENFIRSYTRDSCRSQEFYFRSDIFSPVKPSETTVSVQWDINTIVNGKSGIFCGLIPLVREYLDKSPDLSREQKLSLYPYLNLIRDRANGNLMTGANWIREFVTSHPSYKQDSLVCEQICYDLMVSVNEMSRVNSPRIPGPSQQPLDFYLIEDDL